MPTCTTSKAQDGDGWAPYGARAPTLYEVRIPGIMQVYSTLSNMFVQMRSPAGGFPTGGSTPTAGFGPGTSMPGGSNPNGFGPGAGINGGNSQANLGEGLASGFRNFPAMSQQFSRTHIARSLLGEVGAGLLLPYALHGTLTCEVIMDFRLRTFLSGVG